MSTETNTTPKEGARLYDAEHPYYCQRGNYFANDCHVSFDTWDSFVYVEGDADLDMNLVYRWDWKRAADDDERVRDTPSSAREDRLLLFYMGQRKARCRSVEIAVCRDDEPAVREWLAVRWAHLQKLWTPFTAP